MSGLGGPGLLAPPVPCLSSGKRLYVIPAYSHTASSTQEKCTKKGQEQKETKPKQVTETPKMNPDVWIIGDRVLN